MRSKPWSTGIRLTKIKSVTLVAAAAAVVLAMLLITSCQPTATASREAWVPHARFVDSIGEDSEVRFVRLEEPGNMRYGGTNRYVKSVIQGAPGSLAWQVDLPEGEAMLEFTLGFLCPKDTIPGPVSVRIVVEHEGLREEIYGNKLWVRFLERGFFNYDERIPLDGLAGKEVTFHFESEVAEGGPKGVEIAWGYPEVYRREHTELPNIILVCMDTLRADRVGYINPKSELMPNLAELAADGVAFTKAISQSPWTLPSVATVLTGQYPSFHGAGKRIFLPEAIKPDQLDEEMKELGFMNRKSDFIISKLPDRSATLPDLMEGKYRCELINGNTLIGRATNVSIRFPSFVEGTRKGWSLTRRAEEWLQDNHDKRFFLYVHYMEPHEWPFYYKERWGSESRHEAEQARWMYDELVQIGDGFFGRLIKRIKELGLYENSLIIFYADHGEHLYDEMFDIAGHGSTLSNLLLHVPMVVKFPGNEHAGAVVGDYVKLADIFDTIVSESGTELPEGFTSQGVPLRDIVEGKLEGSHRDTISEFLLYGGEKIALQTGPHRLIHNYENGKQRLVEADTDKRIPFSSSREAREVSNRLIKQILAYIHLAEMAQEGLEVSEFSEEELEALRQLGYIQ